ncbi:hypothetical protein AYI68_g2101 [Smittium mucronatum]|uniref:Uncharacterized protein n=1 Tax=Smittium mucronatum TaxID=133383 RepID=A0A1R0H3Q1_9FUNG|nr:hypothetical protein AYI68_g2101 [Smittium mucronatum]
MISIEALELSEDLDPSFNLAGGPVMEDLVSSFMGLLLSSGPNPQVRFSPIIPKLGAVQTLSAVSTYNNRRSVDRWSNGVITALRSLLGEGEEYIGDSMFDVSSPLAA